MEESSWIELLRQVERGNKTPEVALEELRNLPFKEMGFAKIDHHRQLRQGAAEVIYCPGKTNEQICSIFIELIKCGGNVIATRATKDNYEYVKESIPDIEFFDAAKIITYWPKRIQTKGIITVISAGTADQAVSEEAAVTAEILGNKVDRVYDVGVAGIHRLLAHAETLQMAKVIIVVAGMEGALASVVGGLVKCPVIAVPTSVGYGTNFNGVAPLLAMLNSCASGMAVVNIDNGFGAAMMAHRINRIGEDQE